jgi:hypothetical protein
MKHKQQLLIIALISLMGCGKTERVDTQAVREEIKQREIRKISDVEIFDRASSLAKEDEQVILDCLNKSSQVAENFPIAGCFQKRDSTRILSGKLFFGNDTVGTNEVENSLISAYHYDFENKKPLYSNLQDLKDNRLLYSFPLYKNDSVFSLTNQNGALGIVLIYYSKKEVIKSMY